MKATLIISRGCVQLMLSACDMYSTQIGAPAYVQMAFKETSYSHRAGLSEILFIDSLLILLRVRSSFTVG